MLEIKDLTINYKNKNILNNINLNFRDSGIYAILGENGAGKTTLFRTILGLNKLIDGEIILNGKNINNISIKQKAKQISYMPQILDIPFDYSVFDIVEMGLEMHKNFFQKINKNKIHETLAKLGIKDLSQHSIQTLSGGQKALVLLARCIVQNSNIMLLDEPTAYLDIKNQKILLDFIASLKDKIIIINIHDPSIALDYASNLIALKDKNILFNKEKSDVNLSDLQRLYGINMTYHKIENLHFVKAI